MVTEAIWTTDLPTAGPSAHVAAERSAHTAPGSWLQGTGVPAARTSRVRACATGLSTGTSAVLLGAGADVTAAFRAVTPSTAQVAASGARSNSLPGLPPRGAPV